MACCELTALGWGVHPAVAKTLNSEQDGHDVLAHLRDFWRMACPDCRQTDLLPVVREVELAIEEWRR